MEKSLECQPKNILIVWFIWKTSVAKNVKLKLKSQKDRSTIELEKTKKPPFASSEKTAKNTKSMAKS